MMHIFDPCYKIPDRHQIKEMIIDEFNEHHSNIGYDLQKISSKVFFTANMWTSTISSKAYLGLTIHYIDQNWVLWHFLLDIIPFKVCHTGINMAAAITNVLNEFNLLAGKALALTTDNESVMLVCSRDVIKNLKIRIIHQSIRSKWIMDAFRWIKDIYFNPKQHPMIVQRCTIAHSNSRNETI
ncbi:hypothetical protein RirG_128790 [Rhizophagus irregularis DAOM 197198w]|uniref:Zinc finger bed domain-containing protein ricesleeper 2-like n=1 Tax=Rhizophagus irregularis (strain DAOM 197198w) TaxID=1432141 RepID=A0A015KEL7_RHIIW|nr:hypothetical protein RirG_128790 [Rhizophagus irregularis DAOM 197198w]